MRVLLLAGGWSPEREVSLRGAQSIRTALLERGHEVTLADLSEVFEDLPELAPAHDVAFVNLHGAPGEDGLVQALLDRLDLPYQGAGPAGSFLALHKCAAKILFRRAGLLTPEWRFVPELPVRGWQTDLPFPLFAKSNTGGSSLNAFQVRNQAELEDALDKLFAAGQEVILEPLISGREVTCGVLDGKPLPPILIVPKASFFDYHEKYADDGAEEICPAPLPDATLARVQEAALRAHQALGLTDYSRADFILSPKNELYLLEVNTLPGMTSASLVPKEAATVGLSFGELIEQLLERAIARKGRAERAGTEREGTNNTGTERA